MKQQTQAYAFGLAAVLCWSTVAVAFKWALQWLSPAQLLLLANITSILVLGTILAWRRQLPQWRDLSGRIWRDSLLFGLLNPFIYYLILFKAYSLLPAQEAQTLNYTWALTMSLLAVPLLHHKLHKQDIIAAILCYCGVLVIATRGQVYDLQFGNALGVGLALLSTVIWALYWIFNTRDPRSPVQGLFLNFVCALPLITLYCAFNGELQSIDWRGLPAALYVGVFEMGLTFVWWLTAMKYTNSTAKISNLIFLSPCLSLIFIHIFLGETILPSTLWGLVLILGGLIWQQTGKKTANQAH